MRGRAALLLWLLAACAQVADPGPAREDACGTAELKAAFDRALARDLRALRAKAHSLIDRAHGTRAADALLLELEATGSGFRQPLDGFAALGVATRPLDPDTARALGGTAERARVILSVQPESPFATFGVRPGEVALGPDAGSDGRFGLRVVGADGVRDLAIPRWIGLVLAGKSWCEVGDEGALRDLPDLESWTPADTRRLIEAAFQRARAEVLGGESGVVLPDSAPSGGIPPSPAPP
jgi:hypothetical protein